MRKKEKASQITFRLSDKDKEKLERYSRQENKTMTEVLTDQIRRLKIKKK